MAKVLRHILLLLVLITCTTSRAARGDYNVAFYDRWAGYSNALLIKKGLNYLHHNNMIDSALVCYSVVANRYYEKSQSKADVERSLLAMNNLGYIYFYFYGDYQKAYGYLQQCLKLTEKEKIAKNKEYIYLNIADLYSAYSEVIGSENYNQKTIGMYKKAFYTAVENKNWTIVVRSFSTILGSAYDNNDLRTIKNEIDIFNKTHFPKNTELLEFTRLYIKGVNASMRKDYDGALRYFNKLPSTINTKDTPERYMIVANSLCAHVYSIQGKNKEAIKSLKKMEELCNKYNMQDILVGIYKAYFEYYSSIKDEKQAAKYHISYLILKDSLMNESKLKSVSELSFMNQLKQVNDKVKTLSQQRHVQTIIIISSFAVLIVVILSLVLIIRSYRQLKRNHQTLYRKNIETLKLEEEERKQRNEYKSQLNELRKSIETNVQQKPKYGNSALDNEEKEDISRRIRDVMENNKDIYNDDFSMNQLAELIQSKPKYISQTISEKYNKNFYALLNEYRIKEACRRLNDSEHYGNITINGIAESVGFKTRTNFITHFKRVTGLTPSEYLKMANRDNNTDK